uniref:Uncharacterized protein n=1 Tax=Chromera velia CCMP2878 TaxID=1169474 RepID=A0A0G4HEF8_9ALVE|eukprot:Cvel_26754.t1-p1 / transcript=Cvel_26754.t1 / gene=Cvel_26754 / organism=Chromera_velia_CCMP2878 / gene_product=hypothetical protein / transcript_product=hypothetical protein / location=Cvel_scaffold3232:1901-14062(-) / protein_length=1319 / sequence_SO=supercontig / SO=protein_coding / is_pseudo=false
MTSKSLRASSGEGKHLDRRTLTDSLRRLRLDVEEGHTRPSRGDTGKTTGGNGRRPLSALSRRENARSQRTLEEAMRCKTERELLEAQGPYLGSVELESALLDKKLDPVLASLGHTKDVRPKSAPLKVRSAYSFATRPELLEDEGEDEGGDEEDGDRRTLRMMNALALHFSRQALKDPKEDDGIPMIGCGDTDVVNVLRVQLMCIGVSGSKLKEKRKAEAYALERQHQRAEQAAVREIQRRLEARKGFFGFDMDMLAGEAGLPRLAPSSGGKLGRRQSQPSMQPSRGPIGLRIQFTEQGRGDGRIQQENKRPQTAGPERRRHTAPVHSTPRFSLEQLQQGTKPTVQAKEDSQGNPPGPSNVPQNPSTEAGHASAPTSPVARASRPLGLTNQASLPWWERLSKPQLPRMNPKARARREETEGHLLPFDCEKILESLSKKVMEVRQRQALKGQGVKDPERDQHGNLGKANYTKQTMWEIEKDAGKHSVRALSELCAGLPDKQARIMGAISLAYFTQYWLIALVGGVAAFSLNSMLKVARDGKKRRQHLKGVMMKAGNRMTFLNSLKRMNLARSRVRFLANCALFSLSRHARNRLMQAAFKKVNLLIIKLQTFYKSWKSFIRRMVLDKLEQRFFALEKEWIQGMLNGEWKKLQKLASSEDPSAKESFQNLFRERLYGAILDSQAKTRGILDKTSPSARRKGSMGQPLYPSSRRGSTLGVSRVMRNQPSVHAEAPAAEPSGPTALKGNLLELPVDDSPHGGPQRQGGRPVPSALPLPPRAMEEEAVATPLPASVRAARRNSLLFFIDAKAHYTDKYAGRSRQVFSEAFDKVLVGAIHCTLQPPIRARKTLGLVSSSGRDSAALGGHRRTSTSRGHRSSFSGGPRGGTGGSDGEGGVSDREKEKERRDREGPRRTRMPDEGGPRGNFYDLSDGITVKHIQLTPVQGMVFLRNPQVCLNIIGGFEAGPPTKEALKADCDAARVTVNSDQLRLPALGRRDVLTREVIRRCRQRQSLLMIQESPKEVMRRRSVLIEEANREIALQKDGSRPAAATRRGGPRSPTSALMDALLAKQPSLPPSESTIGASPSQRSKKKSKEEGRASPKNTKLKKRPQTAGLSLSLSAKSQNFNFEDFEEIPEVPTDKVEFKVVPVEAAPHLTAPPSDGSIQRPQSSDSVKRQSHMQQPQSSDSVKRQSHMQQPQSADYAKRRSTFLKHPAAKAGGRDLRRATVRALKQGAKLTQAAGAAQNAKASRAAGVSKEVLEMERKLMKDVDERTREKNRPWELTDDELLSLIESAHLWWFNAVGQLTKELFAEGKLEEDERTSAQ